MTYPGPPGQHQYYPPPPPWQPSPQPKKPRRWPWVVGGFIGLVVIGAAVSPSQSDTTASSTAATVASRATSSVRPAPVTVPPATPTPTAAAQQQSGPMTTFDDVETLAVGEDIAPGQYVTSGAPGGFLQNNCYYEIHKRESGTFSDLIKNGNIGEGAKGRVSLKAGQYFSSHGGCTWTKSG